jgi:hypothetical protein
MRIVRNPILWILLGALWFIMPRPVAAQTSSAPAAPSVPSGQADWRNGTLRVFLDGSTMGSDYVRTEIPFVNYVRDRKDADVHILTTALSSGSGVEYRIEFIGLERFKDIRFTLDFFSNRLQTEDERRAGFVRVLKKGLMPFASQTLVEDMLAVTFKETLKPAPVTDPWNSWIFGFSLSGSVSAEQSYRNSSWRGSLSVNRVTTDMKISASFNRSVNISSYTILDETIDTSTRNWRFGGLVVKSLGEHWSAGGWVAASSSTYSNEDYSIRAAPALEYDVFPYSQATRKSLCVLYRLGWGYYKYIEETIFDKTREMLWSHSLTASLDLTQPWGSASASIQASQYLHDLSKNRLSVNGYTSIRVWKGFSVNLDGGFSMIHDQLSLVKGSLSQEEVFLRLRELSTTFNYYVSFGIGYTFGSSLSRAVNPRFGDSGYY